MDKYVRLTKIVTNEKGEPVVRCSFYGTGDCLDSTTHNCAECKMFQSFLNQLCAFEDVYAAVVDD